MIHSSTGVMRSLPALSFHVAVMSTLSPLSFGAPFKYFESICPGGASLAAGVVRPEPFAPSSSMAKCKSVG